MRQLLLILCCCLVTCHPTVKPDPPCSIKYTETEVICNCQNLDIHVIPEHLPSNTTILDLDNNVINAVHRGQLFNYHRLKNLSLANNNISEIEANSLDGLLHLQYLDISGKYGIFLP